MRIVQLVEVIGPQISIRLLVAQDMIDDDQDAMSYGHDSFVGTASFGEPAIVRY
jgi:hypothetical protein